MTDLPPSKAAPNLAALCRDYIRAEVLAWRKFTTVMAMLALSVGVVIGCHAQPAPRPEVPGIPEAASGTAKIEVLADHTVATVAEIEKTSTGDNKVRAAIAAKLAGDIRAEVPRVAENLIVAQRAADEVARAMESLRIESAAKLKDAEHRYKSLEAKWYVKTGRFTERVIAWVVGAWLAFGIASIVFGVMGGGWLKLSMSIVRLLPLANPFAFARDTINRRLGA